MKYYSVIAALLLSITILLLGCRNHKDGRTTDTTGNVIKSKEIPADESGSGSIEIQSEIKKVTLPEDFIFPITDGSTSTTNLDNAVRGAILGGEQKTAHSKTYEAFDNFLNGECELIFTTPLSEKQLQTMETFGFQHEAEPVAGEGFVFVVNKNNPVDTLTVEQIKGIYSGKITNWSEVGGNDAEIIAYQRNVDSGSQNYMIAFMGDTPLMEPVTDQIPASMSGILDVVANYDNGINAIGYSVYAYSDGMYENLSEIKYIKVNGTEPSLETLADGSYPLLGYNYAVFSADEPVDSSVRTLVKWMQSDEGQQVIADAGYIPYRKVAGLTLPDSTAILPAGTLYMAKGTSSIARPETAADYDYLCRTLPKSFTVDGLDEKIQNFITAAKDELSQIDEAEMRSYITARSKYNRDPVLSTDNKLFNGYLSVTVGWRYYWDAEYAPDYYYDVRTAVFDIYTGEQLTLSDLFFEGLDFVPILNHCLSSEAVTPYSPFGATYDMLRDFTGLYEGEFAFTADSIIIRPGTCFADGVVLSLDDISEYMVTSIPRDMKGYIEETTPVYKTIKFSAARDIGYVEEKNGITIWYLDNEKAPLSDEVCGKVNAFINSLYETCFTEEALHAFVKSKGFDAEEVFVGPFPDFTTVLHGNRMIEFCGANQAFLKNGTEYEYFTVIDGHYNPYYFAYFFNTQTGEALQINDLFTDGWEAAAEYYVYDDSFNDNDIRSNMKYTAEFDKTRCRITGIMNYIEPRYYRGDLSDLEWPAVVYVVTDDDESVAISIPREYIK